MKTWGARVLLVAVPVLLLALLPLIGVWAVGAPLRQYTEFPPETQYVEHAGFSRPAFVVVATLIVALILPFLLRLLRSRRNVAPPAVTACFPHSALRTPHSPFPWWGWLGLLSLAVTWTLAWTRFRWFAPLQLFTFSPLWFSYILIVNALTLRRTGGCMLRDRPRYFLSLLAASAAFWWFFEYLNRFVQNWHYIRAGDLTPLKYFIFATLPFSTVLPAVLGTYELLASFPSAAAGLDNFVRVRPARPRATAAAMLAVFAAGLAGIGVWPDYLFPLLWVSPLAVMTACQALSGQNTIFAPLRSGNWRRIWLLALSALICGCFWEMWNYFSLAKWAYAIPFVGRFRLFEMPALGYAGYLPFGLECAVMADMIGGRSSARTERVEPECGYADDLRRLINNERL